MLHRRVGQGNVLDDEGCRCGPHNLNPGSLDDATRKWVTLYGFARTEGWRWPLDARSGPISAGDQPGRRITAADPQDSSDGCTNGRQHHHTAASKQGGDAASGPSTSHHPPAARHRRQQPTDARNSAGRGRAGRRTIAADPSDSSVTDSANDPMSCLAHVGSQQRHPEAAGQSDAIESASAEWDLPGKASHRGGCRRSRTFTYIRTPRRGAVRSWQV